MTAELRDDSRAESAQGEMHSMTSFSIVVPAYNAEATLGETLDAVLAQEFADWECVVVDDGSTDSTPEIAESYCDRDERFRLVRQQNTGTAGAYRAGVAAAVSDLLVICASDDLLLPAHLRVMDELICRKPDFEIYSCNGQFLYDESGVRETVYTAPEWLAERSLSLDQVIATCFFSVGVVFRRSIYTLTGGHRPGVYVDDYDLWLRAMARGARHTYTPEVLAVHRISGFQQSANVIRLREANIEVFQRLLEEKDVTPAQAVLIEASIARDRGVISDYRAALVLERQSQRIREFAQQLVGPRRVDDAMALVRRVSGVTGPARRLLARLRLLRPGGTDRAE